MKPINLFPLAFIFAGLITVQTAFAQSHTLRRADFDANWHFHLGDVPEAKNTNFVDNSWSELNLPHDWSIEGTFNKDNPAAWVVGLYQAASAGTGKHLCYLKLIEINQYS